MRRTLVAFTLFLILLSTTFITVKTESSGNENKTFYSKKIDESYRYNSQGLIYIHLEGDGYERGFQHGSLLAAEIVDKITRLSNLIHNSPMFRLIQIDQNSSKYEELSNLWWDFLRNRIHKIYWDRYPQEYQEEIRGIAEGVHAQGHKIHGRDVDYIDILTSNQHSEYMISMTNANRGLHPLRYFYNSIKNLVPKGFPDEEQFLSIFLNTHPTHHCSAFIATGNATTDGQIVAAQETQIGVWWLPYYSAQRSNVIIDIAPTEGYRFIMSSGPGHIWSDENYYQNEEGIIIVDTTAPQGLWINKGYSMVIRTRIAAQYSKSIDEALFYLKNKNNGLWSAVYLIGDTKTGEIARFELALYNSETWRTSDGYYWSANNAQDIGVRAEAYGFSIKDILSRLKNRFLSLLGKNVGFEYTTLRYHPLQRDIKFKELGDKYYGDIDIEIVKNKIMNEPPVSNMWAMDLKATDTKLVNENSLWAYWGNCEERIWNVSYLTHNLKGGKDVPPAGWTLINGMPEKHDYDLPNSINHDPSGNYKINWLYDFAEGHEGRNSWYAKLAQNNNTVFAAGSNGIVYALNASIGENIWKKQINNNDKDTWINNNEEFLAIGWKNETLAINDSTGEIIWRNNNTDYICSRPVFLDEKIFFGSRYGDIYALNQENGEIIWNTTFEKQDVYLAVDKDNTRIITTCGNRCYAINPEDGDIIWEFNGEGMFVSAAEIYKNTVFFGSTNTNIYAINAENGELKWKQKTGWSIQTTPDVLEDTVYVGSMDHNLYAFNADNGKKLWSFNGKAAIKSSPLVYEENVFFGCDDGRFYAINKSNGELIWSYSPAHTINDDIYNYITTSITSDCIAENGQVFMSANGMIYSLNAQKQLTQP